MATVCSSRCVYAGDAGSSGTTTSVSLQILVDGYRVTVLQLGGQSGKTGQLGSQAQVPLAEPFNDMTCVVSSLRLSARLE